MCLDEPRGIDEFEHLAGDAGLISERRSVLWTAEEVGLSIRGDAG